MKLGPHLAFNFLEQARLAISETIGPIAYAFHVDTLK